jgi:hypothetical protein
MTVGVAQLVLHTADLETVCSAYLADGWKESFRTERLPNHPAKIQFQTVARTALDISHLACSAKTPVEVTCYAGQAPTGTTVYELDGPVVLLHACKPDASRAFWRALGFTETEENMLEAQTVLPAWRLRVTLRPRTGERPHTSVDADGCVLVTLLTTAIERELEQMAATGLLLRSTTAWQENVGGRMVTVAFVEGPSGELVELLQLSGGAR